MDQSLSNQDQAIFSPENNYALHLIPTAIRCILQSNMPRIEGDQIPESIKLASDLSRALVGTGATHDPRIHVQVFELKGNPIFVEAQQGANGSLETIAVTFPSDINRSLSPIFGFLPLSSDRQPDEEGA